MDLNKKETRINQMEPDEIEINRLITSGEYLPVQESALDDKELQKYLIDSLLQIYKDHPAIVALTGAPASGKSILVVELLEQLNSQGHPADAISTDGFSMHSRKERNEKIAQGSKPHEVKDFELNKQIVSAVRKGEAIKAPVYNEQTGDAVVAPKQDWHQLQPNLRFLIEEGDFQPLDDPDLSIYLHVPTVTRRKNRIERDMSKRTEGNIDTVNPESIGKSFDFRIGSQFYPYTLPQASKSDILIVTDTQPAKSHPHSHQYSYQVFRRSHLK